MKKLYIGIFATALMSGTALAHTPPPPPPPEPIMSSPIYTTSGFDWDGFYMGLGITGTAWNPASPSYGFLDVIAGVNVTAGDVLFGLEGWIGGYSDGGTDNGFSGGLAGRLGYLVSPEVLLYVSGGGQFFDAGARYGTIGGGVEFAVTDNVSLDLEYKYWGWSTTAFTGNSLGASVNWGF